jgi:hypothetical protein
MPPRKKTARRKRPRAPKARRQEAAVKIRVRMYRQGLGDCFLVTFFTDPKPCHMLIDCGTLGATTTGVDLKDVAADIAGQTGSHLNLLVATHEHKDHLSGFNSQKKAFDQITVDRVWVAWTENKDDADAKAIQKYPNDLKMALRAAVNALDATPAGSDEDKKTAQAWNAGIRRLLGFFGDIPDGGPLGADFAKTVDEAMDYVLSRDSSQKKFRDPGELMEPEWLPGIRFYILGPPRSLEKIRTMGEHGDAELYDLAGGAARGFAAGARCFASAGSWSDDAAELQGAELEEFERSFPFELRYRFDATDAAQRQQHYPTYETPGEDWRRIDSDWLGVAPDFALQLDSFTNNTSLALAIERVADGRVLLFPADAQMGNWLSWQELEWKIKDSGNQTKTVKMKDLLGSTVFYKVGHHASHNATMKEHGLELMKSDELVAFIPVDRAVALKKKPPWQMPAKNLHDRLLEKTQGRVLRSDLGWPKDSERPDSVTQQAWKKLPAKINVTVDDLFIDYELD